MELLRISIENTYIFLINYLNFFELIYKRATLRALSSVGRAPPF